MSQLGLNNGLLGDRGEGGIVERKTRSRIHNLKYLARESEENVVQL